jgi:hypothetical protein
MATREAQSRHRVDAAVAEPHRAGFSSKAMSELSTRIAIFGALEIAHSPGLPLRPPTQRVLGLLGYLIAHHDVPQAREKRSICSGQICRRARGGGCCPTRSGARAGC